MHSTSSSCTITWHRATVAARVLQHPTFWSGMFTAGVTAGWLLAAPTIVRYPDPGIRPRYSIAKSLTLDGGDTTPELEAEPAFEVSSAVSTDGRGALTRNRVIRDWWEGWTLPTSRVSPVSPPSA